MEGTERIVLENLCMLRNGSKVLVEDKITEDIRGIIFPGGHVEEHEPIVDSVIREMKEETGLTIEDPVLCGVKNWIDETGTRYDEEFITTEPVKKMNEAYKAFKLHCPEKIVRQAT